MYLSCPESSRDVDRSEVPASLALTQCKNTSVNPLPGADLWGAPGWCICSSICVAYASSRGTWATCMTGQVTPTAGMPFLCGRGVHVTHTLSLAGTWIPNSGLERECEVTQRLCDGVSVSHACPSWVHASNNGS